MQVRLLAAGTRLPSWLNQGFDEFAKRLPPECALNLTEIPLTRRTKGGTVEHYRATEGQRMLGYLQKDLSVVALDVRGQSWTTQELAGRLGDWLMARRDVALLIGGPDGLAPQCLERAEQRWSLSSLTLPHGLVRVLVAEQIYRAWSILKRHPYHRE